MLPFGASAYDLNEYGLPNVELENWYAEQRPELSQVRLLPTPGLVEFSDLSAPTAGKWSDGLFSEDLIVADGTALKRVTQSGVSSQIATIAEGAARPQFAVSQVNMVCASGGSASIVRADGLTDVRLPGGGAISAVAELGQRFLYAERDAGRFWWSKPGEPAEIPGNYFATAESEPDRLVGLLVHRGLVYLFGSQSVESWAPTGSNARAFIARRGAVLSEGLIGPDALTQSDQAMFMVSRRGRVLRLDDLNQTRISTTPIEARIRALSYANQSRVSLSVWRWRSHEFLRVFVPGQGVWNYDLLTGAWHRQRTLGSDVHFVTNYVEAWGQDFALGAGGLYSLRSDTYTEAGEEVRRVADALFPVQDGRPSIDKLTIYTSTENVPSSGQGSTPKMMLQVATDGVTFGGEIIRDLPTTGEYTAPVQFGPLGRMTPPVAKIRAAVSDPVGTSLGLARFNLARS